MVNGLTDLERCSEPEVIETGRLLNELFESVSGVTFSSPAVWLTGESVTAGDWHWSRPAVAHSLYEACW